MRFARLQLTNIRSFQSADLELSPHVTLVVGENNSGKSTLLQGILSVQHPYIGPESIRYGATGAKIRVEMTAFDALEFHPKLRDFVRNTTNADSIVAMEVSLHREPAGSEWKFLLP